MGEVYAAEDTRLKRKVAIKVLPEDVAADPVRVTRFKTEAQAVAALNHPNIVTIFSVEESGSIHFLTMELVEGDTLASMIPKDGFDVATFLRLAVPMADALCVAHGKGIIHRDLKPAQYNGNQRRQSENFRLWPGKTFDTGLRSRRFKSRNNCRDKRRHSYRDSPLHVSRAASRKKVGFSFRYFFTGNYLL